MLFRQVIFLSNYPNRLTCRQGKNGISTILLTTLRFKRKVHLITVIRRRRVPISMGIRMTLIRSRRDYYALRYSRSTQYINDALRRGTANTWRRIRFSSRFYFYCFLTITIIGTFFYTITNLRIFFFRVFFCPGAGVVV